MLPKYLGQRRCWRAKVWPTESQEAMMDIQRIAAFSQGSKLLFVWLMMLGRVEVFSVLVLFFPGFWRRV